MKAEFFDIDGVVLFEPQVFEDLRGYFFESYSKRKFDDLIGYSIDFVQDNHVFSKYGVLRGMHWQIEKPMDKLIRCVKGKIFDVAVDIRKGSPTFGKYAGVFLSEENKRMFLVPKGFAHGYVSLSDETVVLYKCSNFYFPEGERAFRFDDPDVGIDWPVEPERIIQNDKDKRAPFLRELKDRDIF